MTNRVSQYVSLAGLAGRASGLSLAVAGGPADSVIVESPSSTIGNIEIASSSGGNRRFIQNELEDDRRSRTTMAVSSPQRRLMMGM
jgi:hypothetical protein